MMNNLEIMQHNLRFIRDELGWSAVELSEMLGCTRQQIQILESGKSKMTKPYYLAILWILEHETDMDTEKKKTIDLLLSKKVKKVISYES